MSFSRYGSLYFVEDVFPGYTKATVNGDISQKDEIESRFVIGPVISRDIWDRERSQMDISRGPWATTQEYLTAIAMRETAWISKHAKPKETGSIFTTPEQEIGPEVHLKLYREFLELIPYLLSKEENLVKPVIWHPDLHSPNIFVDGTKITSIIDCQESWSGPACLQVRQPKLVDYSGPVLLKLPASYKDITDPDKKADVRTQVEKSIVLWAYETETKQENPALHKIFQMHQGRTIRNLVGFSRMTWEGEVLPFKECLIRVTKNWDSFNTGIPCPVRFIEAELEEHLRDGEGWNEKANFWESVQHLVNRDGWTSNETYEQALQLFRQMREASLETLSGEERAAFEKRTRWAVRTPIDS